MSLEKSAWTEEDVLRFKGLEESIRLEFKAGALLDGSEAKWVSDLSRQTSAFANTEGGVIVLGLTEEKVGRNRVAGDLDGVPESFSRDQIQRKIEGNVSPYLSGLRVHRVPIKSIPGRAVFIIQVPAGKTAYQANDGKYYGRSELEVKHLPDHEIRMRMAKGSVPRASLVPLVRTIESATANEAKIRAEHRGIIERNRDLTTKLEPTDLPAFFDLMEASIKPDIVTYDFWFMNDGELTIREPSIETTEYFQCDSHGNISATKKTSRINLEEEIIYPGDHRTLNQGRRDIYLKRDRSTLDQKLRVDWKIYLDNAPPITGELDLAEFIRTALEEADSGKDLG